jgi:predicted choloylglycine hydrolase
MRNLVQGRPTFVWPWSLNWYGAIHKQQQAGQHPTLTFIIKDNKVKVIQNWQKEESDKKIKQLSNANGVFIFWEYNN